MAEEFRLFIDPPADAAWNMACDEAMLQGVIKGRCPPTLRFYQWNPAAISIGYFQKAKQELYLDRCRVNRIDVVRRLTGGRAVLHSAEVTYSVVIPETYSGISTSVTKAYLFFSRAIIAGLSGLGIGAVISPIKKGSLGGEQGRSAVCFDAPSSYEILIQGKKAVGSAQVRQQGAVLQHGSIVLDFSFDLVTKLISNSRLVSNALAVEELSNRAIGLNQATGQKLTFIEVVSALRQGFAEQCNMNLVPGQRTEWELALIETLKKNKYGCEQWNYRL